MLSLGGVLLCLLPLYARCPRISDIFSINERIQKRNTAFDKYLNTADRIWDFVIRNRSGGLLSLIWFRMGYENLTFFLRLVYRNSELAITAVTPISKPVLSTEPVSYYTCKSSSHLRQSTTVSTRTTAIDTNTIYCYC